MPNATGTDNRFNYVYHTDTDTRAYRIQEGKFDGCVWVYREVKMPAIDVPLEEAEEIPLTFRYELLYNKEGVVDEDNVDEFRDLIGDILLTLIEEGLEHDQVRINSIGNNDT